MHCIHRKLNCNPTIKQKDHFNYFCTISCSSFKNSSTDILKYENKEGEIDHHRILILEVTVKSKKWSPSVPHKQQLYASLSRYLFCRVAFDVRAQMQRCLERYWNLVNFPCDDQAIPTSECWTKKVKRIPVTLLSSFCICEIFLHLLSQSACVFSFVPPWELCN